MIQNFHYGAIAGINSLYLYAVLAYLAIIRDTTLFFNPKITTICFYFSTNIHVYVAVLIISASPPEL